MAKFFTFFPATVIMGIWFFIATQLELDKSEKWKIFLYVSPIVILLIEFIKSSSNSLAVQIYDAFIAAVMVLVTGFYLGVLYAHNYDLSFFHFYYSMIFFLDAVLSPSNAFKQVRRDFGPLVGNN